LLFGILKTAASGEIRVSGKSKSNLYLEQSTMNKHFLLHSYRLKLQLKITAYSLQLTAYKVTRFEMRVM
jgi:hypothetical protein